mmetsp:Transcript_32234/g.37584  ORF Transcript_32234/g.37584 Transcript_32234/m.37584 type:complete len:359 (+) Transcript_32234:81-1157(+)
MKRRTVGKTDTSTSGAAALTLSNGSIQSRKDGSSKTFTRSLILVILALVCFVFNQNKQFEEEKLSIIRKETIKSHDELEKHKTLNSDLKRKLDDATTLTAEMRKSKEKLEAKLRGSNSKNLSVKEQKKELDHQNGRSDVEELKKGLDYVKGQVKHLIEEIKRTDKNAVLEKFGEGPYKVEFQLDFPPEEVPSGTADSFIIEMAPLDLMPHTVHFFLEQASRGLFDGSSFHRNARHVLQGGPISNHLNPNENVRKKFKQADLMSVSFQEYHPDFPHVKYTLGYAGRPGGPDFYVSTLDNTKNHGPGGQTAYAVQSEADPCFAKVVKGFDAVDRMHQMSVQEGGYNRLKHYVAIKSVKIL